MYLGSHSSYRLLIRQRAYVGFENLSEFFWNESSWVHLLSAQVSIFARSTAQHSATGAQTRFRRFPASMVVLSNYVRQQTLHNQRSTGHTWFAPHQSFVAIAHFVAIVRCSRHTRQSSFASQRVFTTFLIGYKIRRTKTPMMFRMNGFKVSIQISFNKLSKSNREQ